MSKKCALIGLQKSIERHHPLFWAPLIALFGLVWANAASADTKTDLKLANTLPGNYLAALVAGLSNDTSAAAFYYSESMKFDSRSVDLTERAFVTLLAEGKMTEALPLAEAVSRRNAGSGIAQLALAVRAIQSDQFSTARNVLKRGGHTQTTDVTATLLTAWSWLGSGSPKHAIELIDRMPDEPGTRIFRLVHRGLIAKVNGKIDEARKSLEAAYNADPQSLRTAELFAQFLSANGQVEQARTIYQNLQTIFPRHPVIKNALAKLNAGKQLDDEIRSESDGVAEALYGLGSAVTRDGDELASLIYLRLAIWLAPDHAFAAMAMADTYERMKQPDSANESYALIPKTSPFRLTADVQRAFNLEQLGQQDEAILLLKSIIPSAESDIEPLIALGNIYRSRKAFAEASESYSLAIEKVENPTAGHWSLFYARGIAYERLKQWPKAEADFKKALELSPEQPLVLNYLGYSWVEQNMNLDEAFKMLRRAVEQRPTDGYIVDSLGWAYYRLSQYENALQLMEKAVDLKAADPTINDHLGDVYWRLGRELEAKFQWNHARDLNPEPEDLPKILEKIEKGLPPISSGSGG